MRRGAFVAAVAAAAGLMIVLPRRAGAFVLPPTAMGSVATRPRLPVCAVPGRSLGEADPDAKDAAMRKARERRRRAQSEPRARGWYKKKHRPISKGQKRAIQRTWGAFGIDLPFGCVLDLDSYMLHPSGEAPRPHTILNVGFGKGEDLVHMSGTLGDALFLGVEIHRASLASALELLEAVRACSLAHARSWGRACVRVCVCARTHTRTHAPMLQPCARWDADDACACRRQTAQMCACAARMLPSCSAATCRPSRWTKCGFSSPTLGPPLPTRSGESYARRL